MQRIQPTTCRILQSLLVALLFITFTSCKEGGLATGPEPEPPEDFPESRTTDTLTVSEPEADDRQVDEGESTKTQRWICTTKTLSVLDGNG